MTLKEKFFEFQMRIYYYNIQFVLFLKREIKNTKIYNIVLLLFLPYFLLRGIIFGAYELIYARAHMSRLIIQEKNKAFDHELAIVGIAKNEGQYIKEWLDYHLLVGVTKFYIYDNESTDNIQEVLKPYIANEIVHYVKYPGKARQLPAYNDAIEKHRDLCRHMAFIDLDEFILPIEENGNIAHLVNNILSQTKSAAGLGINWSIFGSSGVENHETGFVCERFTKRGEKQHWGNRHIKTICNPRLVKTYVSAHFPIYKLGAFSINESGTRLYAWYNKPVSWNFIRINHYIVKSKEEWQKKMNRGLADREGVYHMSRFHKYDLNDVIDVSINHMLRK